MSLNKNEKNKNKNNKQSMLLHHIINYFNKLHKIKFGFAWSQHHRPQEKIYE